MVDWGLIIVTVMLSVLIVGASVLLVIIYGHPDDRNTAMFPKFIVIASLFLSFGSVLALPLDVANQAGMGGGLNMILLWNIIFYSIMIGCVFVLPYAFFYYESDNNPEVQGQVGAWTGQAGIALQYTFIGAIVFGILLGISWMFWNIALIPMATIVKDVTAATGEPMFSSQWPPSDSSALCPTIALSAVTNAGSGATLCAQYVFIWPVEVSFIIYCSALLAFIGWIFLVVFLGIGLIALPVDLLNEFRTRPYPMTAVEFAKQKITIGKRATVLLQRTMELKTGKEDLERKIKKKNRRTDKATQNKLEAELHALKRDKRLLEESYYQKGGNVVYYFAVLLGGVVGAGLSLTWMMHISLYVLPVDGDPFLNTMFVQLSTAIPNFSMFGVIVFAMYAVYLIACTVKGLFKLGVRIPGIIRIYPMELGNTMMNAFLFNSWVVLVCTIPTVQFCVICFDIYVRGSSVRMIFGSQIRYLKFFQIIWQHSYFLLAIFFFNFLTMVSLVVAPKDTAFEIEKKLKKLEKAADKE